MSQKPVFPSVFSLRTLLLGTAAVVLVSCSGGDDDRLAGELAPPPRVDALAPPMAPDPSAMHPALQIARSRGLKTNVYFNEELQQAVSRLQGMEETLGRLQGDLQGTAMAMQRVEMMRQEIDALNMRFQALQERLIYAGPMMAAPEVVADGTTVTTVTTTTNVDPMAPNPMAMQVAPLDDAGPTPLMGEMAAPSVTPQPTTTTAQMKPVMDEKPAAKAAASSGASTGPAGVQDVRIGTHSDYVRIVLDVTGSETGFTTNLDSAEKLLTVELPKTKWSGDTSETIGGSPLVASYSAQNSGAGSIVAFSLKGNSNVISTKTLKAEGGKPARLIIDLAK